MNVNETYKLVTPDSIWLFQFIKNKNTASNESENLAHLTKEATVPIGTVILIICHVMVETPH